MHLIEAWSYLSINLTLPLLNHGPECHIYSMLVPLSASLDSLFQCFTTLFQWRKIFLIASIKCLWHSVYYLGEKSDPPTSVQSFKSLQEKCLPSLFSRLGQPSCLSCSSYSLCSRVPQSEPPKTCRAWVTLFLTVRSSPTPASSSMASGQWPCVQRLGVLLLFLTCSRAEVLPVSQAAAKAAQGAGQGVAAAQLSGLGSSEAAGVARVRSVKILQSGVEDSPVSCKVRGRGEKVLWAQGRAAFPCCPRQDSSGARNSCSPWRELGCSRDPSHFPQNLHCGTWMFPEETTAPLPEGLSWRPLEQGKSVCKMEQQPRVGGGDCTQLRPLHLSGKQGKEWIWAQEKSLGV